MRQPIHTVYGGAHLFKYDVAAKLGRIAQKAFADHRDLIPVSDDIALRVASKLQREAVEDFRIDFEDGYGWRAPEEEDRHATQAAAEVLRGLQESALPPYLGLRIKNGERGERTLDIFLEQLRGEIPPNFVVCLPKASTADQVARFTKQVNDWDRSLAVELMVETTEGLRQIDALVAATNGKCRAVHFGPYDFTFACGVLANSQGLRHPLCTYARSVISVALGGTGIWLSDGPTATVPVGSREDIRRAWALQLDDIRHALSCGYYAGWDVHPAQIPLRYAAVFSFFWDSLPAAAVRLRNFVDAAAQATRVGSTFDDAATGRALQLFFIRGINCGAFTGTDLQQHLGLSQEQLTGLSF